MDESGVEQREAVARVVATPAALEAIAQLVAQRGPVMFFQSGGCCDGSMPMCFADGEFVIGSHDIRLGEVGGCPFYMDPRQFNVWKHTQLILDVSIGEPEGFSLAAGEDRHFIIRSKVFNADDQTVLNDV
ncbi:MAG: DUF779 domain-containing protein [Acidimicrobiales bacterium]